MVDAEDLKSFGHCDRVGSSPTIPTTLRETLRVASQTSRNASCGKPNFAKASCGKPNFAKASCGEPHVFGCVAQLVRALRSHRRGRWFESNLIHQLKNRPNGRYFYLLYSQSNFENIKWSINVPSGIRLDCLSMPSR